MYEKSFPAKRFQKTLQFLKQTVPPPAKVLDLGVENPFSTIMQNNGYTVSNTQGEDLDLNISAVKTDEYDLITAFEIFEHLVAPFNVLKEVQAQKLVTTVPLKLWFSSAYRSSTDPLDRHYHEFEDWQFDWLLEKAGWKIIQRSKWTNPVKKIGIRPLLRQFTPRYYAIYAERL